jgi:acetylglutamate kinase
MKENMYYGASSLIFQKAEELRNHMTPAEEILWNSIHINEWKLKFRRQHPIANWVVDFYCHPIKLVIELDGEIHNVEEVKRNDEEREKSLKGLGLTILRIKNEQVYKNKKNVLQEIFNTIAKLQSPPLGDGGKLFVIKIGGNIIDDEIKLSSFLNRFATVEGKKILIHGGGKVATKIGDQLGIESKYVDGRRITDAPTIDLVTMVYGGLINKKIVAQLQAFNCNAIGVTGADANLIPATKRKIQNTSSGDGDIDYGFVGDITSSDLKAGGWQLFLNNNLIPVVAPLTHDGKGQILNTNADTMAQEIAKALSSIYDVILIYSFEKAGVLLDVNDESSVINKLNWQEYQKLKAPAINSSEDGGKIFSGMIPKLDNAFKALNSGVKKIIIGKAEELEKLIEGVTGTTISNE